MAALRKRLGVTQEEFARIVGVVAATVHRWEKGIVKPEPQMARKLGRLKEIVDLVQAGFQVEGLKVFFTTPRFKDKGNGTVQDKLTGLIWLKNANCFGVQRWASALTAANTLASGSCGLSDGSVAGDWRLPNVKELQSLLDFGRYNPALPSGHPVSGVNTAVSYWSSTTYVLADGRAWIVHLLDCDSIVILESNLAPVWPVRGGQ